MKKVLFVCVAFALSLMISTHTNAQMKMGSFDEESVLGLIPGLQQRADSILQKYVNDTLKGEYEFEVEQYQTKDSVYKKDSTTKSTAWKLNMKKEISQHFYKIQNWNQYQQQMLQAKQEQILLPYKQKVYGTLDEIIKEQKYTHVLKSDVFLLAPPLDNLSIKVAQRMKLPLPKDVEDAIRAAQGGDKGTPATGGKPTAPRPIQRPAPKRG